MRRGADDEYTYVHLDRLVGSTVNGLPVGTKVLHTGDRIELGRWTASFARDEFADHGRPHGGRVGGARFQPPQAPLRARGTSETGGSHADGSGGGEYY